MGKMKVAIAEDDVADAVAVVASLKASCIETQCIYYFKDISNPQRSGGQYELLKKTVTENGWTGIDCLETDYTRYRGDFDNILNDEKLCLLLDLQLRGDYSEEYYSKRAVVKYGKNLKNPHPDDGGKYGRLFFYTQYDAERNRLNRDFPGHVIEQRSREVFLFDKNEKFMKLFDEA
jgi:hypothetical protein